MTSTPTRRPSSSARSRAFKTAPGTFSIESSKARRANASLAGPTGKEALKSDRPTVFGGLVEDGLFRRWWPLRQ